MYNIHVVSVNFVMAMFLFDSMIRIKEIGIKKIAEGLLIFLIFASPVLVWKFSNSQVDIGLDGDPRADGLMKDLDLSVLAGVA